MLFLKNSGYRIRGARGFLGIKPPIGKGLFDATSDMPLQSFVEIARTSN